MRDWVIIVLSFHIAARLAYVVGVGAALFLQDRRQFLTRRDGPHIAFRRFSRMAGTVMVVDAVTFVVTCLITPRTLHLPVPTTALIAAGALLVVVGAGMKLWAAVRIGWEAWYWHNFFFPGPSEPLDPPGPYRFLENPMYTFGYAWNYGLALICLSLPGLLFAAFDQAAILAFYHAVEKPHWKQVSEPSAYDHGVGGD